MMAGNFLIGCAGWTLGRSRESFPAEGSNLQRYALMFRAVEINSSFHRPHRTSTYERWAAAVPESFRFSVKMPKSITHDRRFVDAIPILDPFLAEVAGLGQKLGCLLVQMPPSMQLDVAIATDFFETLRSKHAGAIVVEPRHSSWFGRGPDKLFNDLKLTRVAADPAVIARAAEPGGIPATIYYRLHGSPQVYYSAYTEGYLDGLAFRLRSYAATGVPVWCIFDNTISGAATANALYLARKIAAAEKARTN